MPAVALRLLAPVGAGRHADQLGEAGAEGAQRRTADRETDLGDAQVATAQQRHRALDPPRHQIAVRRLAVRQPELPAEMPGRHVRAAGERLDVQRLRVFAVDAVAHAAQPREVLEALLRSGFTLVTRMMMSLLRGIAAHARSRIQASYYPEPCTGTRTSPAGDGRDRTMARWAAFAAEEPELATFGEYRLGAATAYPRDGARGCCPPRAPGHADHRSGWVVPVHGADLAQGARPPCTRLVRTAQRGARRIGRAGASSGSLVGPQLVDEPGTRSAVAEASSYAPDDRYVLFELHLPRGPMQRVRRRRAPADDALARDDAVIIGQRRATRKSGARGRPFMSASSMRSNENAPPAWLTHRLAGEHLAGARDVGDPRRHVHGLPEHVEVAFDHRASVDAGMGRECTLPAHRVHEVERCRARRPSRP